MTDTLPSKSQNMGFGRCLREKRPNIGLSLALMEHQNDLIEEWMLKERCIGVLTNLQGNFMYRNFERKPKKSSLS